MAKKLLTVLALLIVVFCAVSCAKDNSNQGKSADSPAKETVNLRLVMPGPAGDYLVVADEEMAKRFNERTNGQYQIKVYSGETLSKLMELFDSVRTGAVEMADVALFLYGGKDNRLNALSMPFLFDNAQAFDSARPEILKLYEPIMQQDHNIKVLALYYNGVDDVMGKKQVKTVDDMKGILTSSSDPMSAKMVEAVGGKTISVPWTDLYTSLDKGVVDNCIYVADGAIQNKLTDIVKYSTSFFGRPAFVWYSINLDVWNKMPKDIQDILTEEVQKTAEEKSKEFMKKDLENSEILKSLGVTVYNLPKEERDKWKAAMQSYIDEQMSSMGEFGKKYLEIAEKANKAHQ